MEVKSAQTTLQVNSAATAVDNNSSEGNRRNNTGKVMAQSAEEKPDKEEEPVKVSISAAGLRRSLALEKAAARENEIAYASEIEVMMNKVDGLSSQIINGNFTTTDRLKFQNEIENLTTELKNLSGDGISFTKHDNKLLSQRIDDLTGMINKAAVYNRSAKALFIVNNQHKSDNTRTKLDIVI